MSQVTSNLKHLIQCRDVCGHDDCTAYGTPTKNGHVRGCTSKCPSCRGRRNRAGGLRKQSTARKRLGIAPQKFGDANEERWGDNVFRNEVKSGAQVRAVATAWLRIERQVDANRPDFGDDHRPCRAVVMPAGWGKDGLVVVRLSTWETLIGPALDEFYGSAS